MLVRVYKRRLALVEIEDESAWEEVATYLHDGLNLAVLRLCDRLWNELRLSHICDIGRVDSCWLSSDLNLGYSWHLNFLHGSRGPSLRLSLAVLGNCFCNGAESCGVGCGHGRDIICLIWLLLCHGLGDIILDLLDGSRSPCLCLRPPILCDCLRNWAESGGIRSLGLRDMLSLIWLLDRLELGRLDRF